MKYATAFLMLMILSVSADPILAAVVPWLYPIDDVTLLGGSPLHIPLDGFDADGDHLTFTALSNNPALVSTFITEGNRSMRISVANLGDMVFELFESRAPQVTGRISELAESGFYDGLTFHRVIDDFMIQGGDPTGDGTGGSGVQFDDEFHVELQHNGSGVLSMAKSSDDTNDSQFFITEAPTRWLDYDHSIFGQLVDGEDVRDAISNVPTNASDKPDTDVIMDSVTIFYDGENGVLMLNAPEGASGTAEVTVTVNDEDGGTDQRTFQVTVMPDTSNSNPFLAQISLVETQVDTPTSVLLEAIDVEGDAVYFDAGYVSNIDLTFSIDNSTGLLTLTPTNGLIGDYSILVGVRPENGSTWDMQRITVSIVPEPATMGLLAFGGLSVLLKRRRRKA